MDILVNRILWQLKTGTF